MWRPRDRSYNYQMALEIEQKFELVNPSQVRAILGSWPEAEFLNSFRQIDRYFNPPHVDFLAADVVSEWLRVRTEEDSATIDYKRWLPLEAKEKTHCEEQSVSIGDSEGLTELLRVLGFRDLVSVDKTRELWRVDEVELAIDDVDGLGSFLELEFKGEARSVDYAHRQIESVVSRLRAEIGPRDRRGYPFLLLSRR